MVFRPGSAERPVQWLAFGDFEQAASKLRFHFIKYLLSVQVKMNYIWSTLVVDHNHIYYIWSSDQALVQWLAFGDFEQAAARVKHAGIITLVIMVRSVEEARKAAAAGADIIVAQVPTIVGFRV